MQNDSLPGKLSLFTVHSSRDIISRRVFWNRRAALQGRVIRARLRYAIPSTHIKPRERVSDHGNMRTSRLRFANTSGFQAIKGC